MEANLGTVDSPFQLNKCPLTALCVMAQAVLLVLETETSLYPHTHIHTGDRRAGL